MNTQRGHDFSWLDHEEGPPVPGGDRPDESSEATLVRLCARYNLNRGVCLEMIDEVMTAFGAAPAEQVTQEALNKLNAKHREAWHMLVAYQQNQMTYKEVLMSTRVMALELGFTTVAGARSITELASKMGFDKQTVNKCALTFQEKMKLPPRETQRDEAARETMSDSRMKQLKGKNQQ